MRRTAAALTSQGRSDALRILRTSYMAVDPSDVELSSRRMAADSTSRYCGPFDMARP